MKKSMVGIWLTAVALMLQVLAGCGGGGTTAAPAGSKIAVLTLSTSGTLTANTQIGALEVTVRLPAGVTVKATPDAVYPSVLVTDPNVVVPTTGGILLSYATYSAATASGPGTVAIRMASGAGFGTGGYAEVTCNIADSSNPSATDFSLTDFVAYDLDSGAVLAGLTAGYTVVFGRDDGTSVTH